MKSEILVTISLRFPMSDAIGLVNALGPIVKEAMSSGGQSVTISVQSHDPGEELEED